MQLTFLGATKTVTGSRYLLKLDHKNILIDCGLFQGVKEIRQKNWETFPIPPHQIDAVIITHAHIDHTGYLPVLIRNGFTGKIYCSEATRDLCTIMLPDSGYLQEEEARFANKYNPSRQHPAVPLYTRAEAENALKYLRPLAFRKKIKLSEETYFTLIPAGHILGATFVQIEHYGKIILFSGDLGRPEDPIMPAPSVMQAADYLVVESTYGDRLHQRSDPMDALASIVTQTASQGGTVLIPAFAVGRAQHLLYLLYQLKCANRIPNIPVYLDSPMARAATDVFCKHSELHRLSADVARRVCETVTIINSREESQALDIDPKPKVIVSASGMLEGGRVLHHFRVFASEAKNTIVFSGFQAPGTRGAEIIAGKEEIRLFGETIVVRAMVKMLHNMSAHADYSEILGWLKNFNHTPRRVFITHGEAAAAHALKEKIHAQYGWHCVVPDFMQEEFLE